MTNSGSQTIPNFSFRCPAAMAAVTTLQHEVKTIKTAHDNVERERDKLKSDLQVQQKIEKRIFEQIFSKGFK